MEHLATTRAEGSDVQLRQSDLQSQSSAASVSTIRRSILSWSHAKMCEGETEKALTKKEDSGISFASHIAKPVSRPSVYPTGLSQREAEQSASDSGGKR